MQNLKPNNLEFFVRQTSVPRLSDGYASLIFKYCDEHPDFTIKLLTKLVQKSNARVIINTQKKQIRPPKKKINGSEDDQIIQKLENNRRKILATLSNKFSVSRLTIWRFRCNFLPWL